MVGCHIVMIMLPKRACKRWYYLEFYRYNATPILTLYCYVKTSIIQLHCTFLLISLTHDDVIKWKHFPRYWPFVRGIHRYPVNSPHKGQWRGALMFSLICAWINGWIINRKAGNLRRYRAHYDVIVMAVKWLPSGRNKFTEIQCFFHVILISFVVLYHSRKK